MDPKKIPPPKFEKEERVRVKGTDLTGWIDATVIDAKKEGKYLYRLELPGFTKYERSGCRYEESDLEPAPSADSIFAKFAQSPEVRERLSAVEKVQIDESIRLWFRRIHTGPGDRPMAETLLGDLYESLGRRRPVVIWCPSPIQSVALPWLYFSLIRSDAWLDCFEDFLSSSSAGARSFDERWNELWQRSGDRALAEMHDRCRTGVESEMESRLIAQLRDEIKLALLSRTLVAAHALPDKLRDSNETWKAEMINEPLKAQNAVRLQCRELFALLFRANRDWEGWGWVEQGYKMFQGDSPRDANSLMGLWGGYAEMSPYRWLAHFEMSELAVTEAIFQEISNHLDQNFWKNFCLWTGLMQSGSEAFFLSDVVFVRPQPLKLEYRGIQIAGTHETILHNETGPALVFEDGYKQYAINGVRVPPVVVENPSLISIAMIDGERNVEVRRVMIEKYGLARYIQDSGAEIIDSDQFGTLHRKAQPNDDPILLIEVKNSTVESDGSRKTYFLRVPPDITSARAAVAWTFGLEANEYRPNVET